MTDKDKKELELIKMTNKFLYYANLSARKAQEENHRKGIPNVYEKDNTIFWHMPNGSITTKNPFE